MPHRVDHIQGQGRYGFGTGMPEDVYGAFSSAAPFVRPEYNEEQFRAAMGFVPVAGTAYNWNQMGPWGRTGSVAMDALDLATGGGGKLPGAALRGLMKLAQRNPFDPKMVSVRGGLPRVDEAGNWLPSINAITGQPEAGVSVYQGAQFPFGRGTVLRNAPWQNIEYDDPTGTIRQNYPSWAQGNTYFVNPLAEQEAVLRGLPEEMYRITGNVMPGVKGSGWEALVNPETISGVKNIPFSQLQRLAPFPSYPAGMHKTGLGFGTGLPITSESMGHKALDLFARHDPQGTPFPINPQFQNAVARWANRANLSSTLPYTTAGRGFDWNEGDFNFAWNTPGLFGGAPPQRPYQTPFNLEEQYQQQAGRRGGWSPGG